MQGRIATSVSNSSGPGLDTLASDVGWGLALLQHQRRVKGGTSIATPSPSSRPSSTTTVAARPASRPNASPNPATYATLYAATMVHSLRASSTAHAAATHTGIGCCYLAMNHSCACTCAAAVLVALPCRPTIAAMQPHTWATPAVVGRVVAVGAKALRGCPSVLVCEGGGADEGVDGWRECWGSECQRLTGTDAVQVGIVRTSSGKWGTW